MKLILYTILVLSFFSGNITLAQHSKRSTPAGRYYWEYLPPGYGDAGNTSTYPLILFLHGGGEISEGGDPLNELNKLLVHGPPKEIKAGHNMCFTVNGQQQCFVVISPQLSNGNSFTSWSGAFVEEFIRYALKQYRIDPARVYLTGPSLGGIGTYEFAQGGESFADSLAAIAPVAGKGNEHTACIIATRNIPVWSFHGDADTQISFVDDQDLINNLKNCDPAPDPLPVLTVFKGLGHVSTIWDAAYRPDNTYFTPNLYEWFLQRTRKEDSNNQIPVVSAGDDRTIVLPNNAITIKGSAMDTDGTIAWYLWTKQSGPAASLRGTLKSSLSVDDMEAGSYVFRLTAMDNAGGTSSDEVTITVLENNGVVTGTDDYEINDKLEEGTMVYIYNVQGQLARKITYHQTDGSDQRNLIDYVNHPGLYIFHIVKTSGKTETRKINIIR